MRANKQKKAEKSAITLRLKALFFDWLFIWAYLLVLFLVLTLIYLLIFDGIPAFTNLQSQLITTITSVIPIIVIFSVMEGSNHFASWGKKKVHLKVEYKGVPMKGSFIRNTLKFLPWQFGHMSTINGIYNGFETPFSVLFFVLSMSLALVYVLQVFLAKDHRHLADRIAGSKVVKQ